MRTRSWPCHRRSAIWRIFRGLLLSSSQLTRLPPELGRLAALKYLSVGASRLSDAPPEIM